MPLFVRFENINGTPFVLRADQINYIGAYHSGSSIGMVGDSEPYTAKGTPQETIEAVLSVLDGSLPEANLTVEPQGTSSH
jgi:hypothetical protein